MRLRTAVALTTALAAGALPLALTPAAGAQAAVYTCSGVGLSLLGVPTAVAGGPTAPCDNANATAADTDTLLGPALLPLGTLRVTALDARTTFPSVTFGRPRAVGYGGLGSLRVSLAGVSLAATGLTASASATCVDSPFGSEPAFGTDGRVGQLEINGQLTPIGADPVDIPLGIGTLHLNNVVQTPTRVTRRALWLQTLLGDVVVGEASAGLDLHCG
jgi:hypothetical protein